MTVYLTEFKAYRVTWTVNGDCAYIAATTGREACYKAYQLLSAIRKDAHYFEMRAKRAFEFDAIADKAGCVKSIHAEVMAVLP